MVTKSQQQEELVNTFVASIPAMQTDIALLKQDTTFLKQASATQNTKSDTIIQTLGNLSVISKAEFEQYKKDEEEWKETFTESNDKRFRIIEKYYEDNKPGIKFANALVGRWTTFLIFLLLAAVVIALIGRFIPVTNLAV